MDETRASIHVLVGIVTDAEGRVLIAQRPVGKHLAGEWEFPGGKRRNSETRLEALRRELSEEIGIDVGRAEPFLDLLVNYPDRSVSLDVWWVHDYSGLVRASEGQAIRWARPDELGKLPILAADAPIVAAILERSNRGPAGT